MPPVERPKPTRREGKPAQTCANQKGQIAQSKKTIARPRVSAELNLAIHPASHTPEEAAQAALITDKKEEAPRSAEEEYRSTQEEHRENQKTSDLGKPTIYPTMTGRIGGLSDEEEAEERRADITSPRRTKPKIDLRGNPNRETRRDYRKANIRSEQRRIGRRRESYRYDHRNYRGRNTKPEEGKRYRSRSDRGEKRPPS